MHFLILILTCLLKDRERGKALNFPRLLLRTEFYGDSVLETMWELQSFPSFLQSFLFPIPRENDKAMFSTQDDF